ncbi:MAG: hypothetical protein ACI8WB_005691 [Phenylobacterium sp.]|jgi:hypothetical protein
MSKKRLKTLSERVAYRISRSKLNVFMRKDFGDLADYDQVGRALRELIAKQFLMKIGYGLYTRARKSPLSNAIIPVKTLSVLATEALVRMNIKVNPSSFEKAYNDGLSTQVPTGRVIAVQGRVSRKIGYNGKYVSFEHGTA